MGPESLSTGDAAVPEIVALPYSDEDLIEIMTDYTRSNELYTDDFMTWVRAELAGNMGWGASEVNDDVISELYHQGYFYGWDDKVAQSIATYLTARGYMDHSE